MEVFVISRIINKKGPEGNDYLVKDLAANHYDWWTESPALAKWYHSEEEAQDDLAKWQKEYPVCRIVRYNPVQTLVNPTQIDKSTMVQRTLKDMLIGR